MSRGSLLPIESDTPLHLIGIGGAGMSSLAVVLHQAGYVVSGSDLYRSPVVESLERAGIRIAIGHDPGNLPARAVVVRSSAVPEDNLEVRSARERGLPVLKLAELVGRLSEARRTLAVAGSHGKSTTTAMLATVLLEAGLDPTVLIGGVLPSLGSGAHFGEGPHLVVEADEFDRRFLHLHPEIAIVTNVEADHLDYYGDFASLVDAFRRFVQLVPDEGWLILNADSPVAVSLAGDESANVVTYGLGPHAEWRATGISRNEWGGNDFYVFAHDTLVGHFRLQVPGRHNVSNALAATVAAGRLGVDFTTAAVALERFAGVQRRLELKGEVQQIRVLDDYAHHPTEIRADLAAIREQHEGRIICLFQPHTYHRLASLFDDFAGAFADADLVFVTDVYAPTGRGPTSGERTAEDLARSILGTWAQYGGDLRSSIDLVSRQARRGDVIITMGAGDVTTAGPEILRLLTERAEES